MRGNETTREDKGGDKTRNEGWGMEEDKEKEATKGWNMNRRG